ncbi:MAG: tetratricopeptide repeat protein [Pyrinomonadaceae bacterium]|nr:tetratricopeptide repeat protein [Pyrinomonadaceae bacterium]
MFRIDPAERLLLRAGKVVPLPPRVFDTLLLLIENAGRALPKEELLQALWPDSFVEEGSLAQNVSLLRKILGESSGERQYIETLPKRGYRFVADIRRLNKENADSLDSGRTTASHRTATTAEKTNPEDVKATSTLTERESDASVTSIAVLPFITLSAEPGEQYLGLGLADALITQLGNIRQIIVRPTSAVRPYSGAREDSVTVGRELCVDAVLEGSIQHADGRVRVTMRLVSIRDEIARWSGKFDADFTDIFALQDSIAERVASALVLKLSLEERARVTKHYTGNSKAYQTYMKGRYFWNKRNAAGLKKAIDFFNSSIERDPTYALAYTGLADAYSLLGKSDGLAPREAFPRAEAAARKALEIDDQLAEAHASLAGVEYLYDWNWQKAEVSFKRAIELNPHYATAHHWYGCLLVSLERFDEAVREMKSAQELDPLSPIINAAVALPCLYSRQYDHAIKQYRKTLDFEPNFIPAHWGLGLAYAQLGLYEEAIAEHQKAVGPTGAHTWRAALLAATYAVAGQREKARQVLDELQALPKRDSPTTYYLAAAYARLNDKDRAFAWLEHAYRKRTAQIADLRVEPEFDNLRSDPRFADLLQRVGLAL